MAFRYDVSFINPFLDAVLDVLTTMAQVSVTPGRPYINKKRVAVGDVTGIIGISGYAQGMMSLTLAKGAILKIVNNMLSEDYTEIDGNIVDAVGELTNMISGQARKHLSEAGMDFKASTPTVVVGKGKALGHISSSPILAIPFETDSGPLVVEVSMAGAEAGPDA